MRYVRQFSIILLVSVLGEGLRVLLPFPVPASVYGLILMLAALGGGLIKVEHVREASAFLIEIMPVMFIPAGVGLLTSWSALKLIWFPVTVITLVTTVIVMAVTGHVTQVVIRKAKRRESNG